MKLISSVCLLAVSVIASPIQAQTLQAQTAQAQPVQIQVPAFDPYAKIAEGKHFTVLATGNIGGPDVVLIPGLATPRDVWAVMAERLKPHYRLHIVQIRGFGDAPGPNKEGPVLQPFVRELADYIDDEIANKGRAAPAIIGHSMGGLSAMMIARDHPQLVSKMLIVDSLPYFGILFGSPVSKERVEKIAAEARTQMARRTENPHLLIADLSEPSDQDPGGIMSITPAGRRKVAIWSAEADPVTVANLMYEVTVTDIRADLARIATPMTLLYPTSPAVPAARADILYQASYADKPQAKLIAIPDSYHFIMLDQPERFQAEVEKFLKG